MSLLDVDQYVCFFPETFEIVEFTLYFGENMNDHIAVVHQHPTAITSAFSGNRQAAVLLLDCLAHTIGNRFDLAVAVPGANDEEIGDNRVGA